MMDPYDALEVAIEQLGKLRDGMDEARKLYSRHGEEASLRLLDKRYYYYRDAAKALEQLRPKKSDRTDPYKD